MTDRIHAACGKPMLHTIWDGHIWLCTRCNNTEPTADGIDDRSFGYVMGGSPFTVWRVCGRCASLINPGGEDLHVAWHEWIKAVTQ